MRSNASSGLAMRTSATGFPEAYIISAKQEDDMKVFALSVAVFASSISTAANCEELEFDVYGEEQTARLTACGVSYVASISAIEAALRYNRLKVANEKLGPAIYVNLNALPINRSDGKPMGSCVISYRLSFENMNYDLPNTLQDKKSRFVTMTYCSDGGLAISDFQSAQNTISVDLRSFVDECISKLLEVSKS